MAVLLFLKTKLAYRKTNFIFLKTKIDARETFFCKTIADGWGIGTRTRHAALRLGAANLVGAITPCGEPG